MKWDVLREGHIDLSRVNYPNIEYMEDMFIRATYDDKFCLDWWDSVKVRDPRVLRQRRIIVANEEDLEINGGVSYP